MSKTTPHPVDLHVGSRIRQQRTLLGMSMEALAEKVGLTYQQVQKYEKGANRCSASRMWAFGKALGVPAAAFFDGLPEGAKAKKSATVVEAGMLTLARHYKALKSPAHRDAVCALAKSLAA
jgi:transcriptional regulator with XRE-family HTH domain